MCSGTSTSPAMRLLLPFAASSWRAAHHCKPLVCSSTAIFMSSCEPGPTLHHTLCSSGAATRARHCQTAASRCFYEDQQIPQDHSRARDRTPFNSALKNSQRRCKKEENDKYKARKSHDNLRIASAKCTSVSFKVPSHQPTTPAQAVAMTVINL